MNVRISIEVFIMRLTRREILEELGRLGVRGLNDLKRACREFEVYWSSLRAGHSRDSRWI
jgi:hypothetical protein